jgi:hypothetical protein
MRFFLLSLTILTCWAAEAPKLPADVQTVLDKATAAETAAQNEADAKILKVKQALVKDLIKLQETYTKKGNLDAANGIRASITKLQEQVQIVLDEQKPKIAPEDWIVGRWNLSFPGFSKIWEFDKKGTVTFTGGPVGKWIVKDATIQVTWPSGNIETVDIPKDMTATETTGTAGSGKQFTVVRVK